MNIIFLRTKGFAFLFTLENPFYMHDEAQIWFDSFPNFVSCLMFLPILSNMFHFAVVILVIQFSWGLTAYCFDFWLRTIRFGTLFFCLDYIAILACVFLQLLASEHSKLSFSNQNYMCWLYSGVPDLWIPLQF